MYSISPFLKFKGHYGVHRPNWAPGGELISESHFFLHHCWECYRKQLYKIWRKKACILYNDKRKVDWLCTFTTVFESKLNQFNGSTVSIGHACTCHKEVHKLLLIRICPTKICVIRLCPKKRYQKQFNAFFVLGSTNEIWQKFVAFQSLSLVLLFFNRI